MQVIRFACTRCGRCCHDLKLPLTVAETIEWLYDGNDVQIICEAIPWPAEPAADDQKAAHRRRRSFAAMSAAMPMRVMVILAAHFSGACPNLAADAQCGIYRRRPLVCRIYPAEINPFIQMKPENKACPSEAWASPGALLERKGLIMDQAVCRDIQRSRDTDARDVPAKARLCLGLGINHTALAEEGFVVHSPGRATLLREITRAAKIGGPAVPKSSWILVSNQSATVASIASMGGSVLQPRDHGDECYRYLGFRPPSILKMNGPAT